MPARLTPRRIADDVIEFEAGSPRHAQPLASAIRNLGHAEDVVAGLDRVSVRFSPLAADAITDTLNALDHIDDIEPKLTEPIEISVYYGGENGPDLEAVSAALNISTDAFIGSHTQRIHTVEMIGFTPGFSYISGLPAEHRVSRLATPRHRVPAGAVGVSAGFTGIYALDGPGGWPLIGRTEAKLFNARSETPFLLTPGQRVKFRAL